MTSRRGPSGRGRCTRITLLAAACLATVAGAASAQGADPGCSAPARNGVGFVVTCPAIGSEQQFVVPRRVTRVRVTAVGASGGAGGRAQYVLSGMPGAPGPGAIAAAILPVKPRSTLYVLTGGVGGTSDLGLPAGGGFSGAGNGGRRGVPGIPAQNNGSSGGGGGGASDVRTCSIHAGSCDTLASRLIVGAGGGGGGGAAEANDFDTAGAGGGAGTDGNGQDGGSPAFDPTVPPGKGATHSAGGAGADATAGAGERGLGGRGANARSVPAAAGDGPGGGGGGGLFGGGGGASPNNPRVDFNFQSGGAGGGGGSSFGPTGTAFALAPARAPGVVTIAYVVTSTSAPSVVVTRPRAGQVLRRLRGRKRRGVVIAGHAGDTAGVQAVTLRLERLPRTGTRCTWLDPTKGLRRSGCARPPSLLAELRPDGSWTYRAELAPGRYRVTADGQDRTGTSGNSAPRRKRVMTFRVSRS